LSREQVSIPACTSYECKTESVAKPPKDSWPKDYKVPNFGQDTDINDSIKHMNDSEAKLGGALSQSIPACNSLGCKTGSAAVPSTNTIPFDDKWGKSD
jgi:hypothetical protein